MSYTTDVILSISIVDDERADDGRMTPGLDGFRRWCEGQAGDRGIGWPEFSARDGGSKGPGVPFTSGASITWTRPASSRRSRRPPGIGPTRSR